MILRRNRFARVKIALNQEEKERALEHKGNRASHHNDFGPMFRSERTYFDFDYNFDSKKKTVREAINEFLALMNYKIDEENEGYIWNPSKGRNNKAVKREVPVGQKAEHKEVKEILKRAKSQAVKISQAKIDFIESIVTKPLDETIEEKPESLNIVITHHHEDIAGMSTDRDWANSSCFRRDGVHKNQPYKKIEKGGMVAYLIRESDKNIDHPLSRVALMRYENEDDPTDFIFEVGENIYGKQLHSFRNEVMNIIEKSNEQTDKGSAVKHSSERGLYLDEFEEEHVDINRVGFDYYIERGDTDGLLEQCKEMNYRGDFGAEDEEIVLQYLIEKGHEYGFREFLNICNGGEKWEADDRTEDMILRYIDENPEYEIIFDYIKAVKWKNMYRKEDIEKTIRDNGDTYDTIKFLEITGGDLGKYINESILRMKPEELRSFSKRLKHQLTDEQFDRIEEILYKSDSVKDLAEFLYGVRDKNAPKYEDYILENIPTIVYPGLAKFIDKDKMMSYILKKHDITVRSICNCIEVMHLKLSKEDTSKLVNKMGTLAVGEDDKFNFTRLLEDKNIKILLSDESKMKILDIVLKIVKNSWVSIYNLYRFFKNDEPAGKRIKNHMVSNFEIRKLIDFINELYAEDRRSLIIQAIKERPVEDFEDLYYTFKDYDVEDFDNFLDIFISKGKEVIDTINRILNYGYAHMSENKRDQIIGWIIKNGNTEQLKRLQKVSVGYIGEDHEYDLENKIKQLEKEEEESKKEIKTSSIKGELLKIARILLSLGQPLRSRPDYGKGGINEELEEMQGI